MAVTRRTGQFASLSLPPLHFPHLLLVAGFSIICVSAEAVPLTGTVTDPENKVIAGAAVRPVQGGSQILDTRSNASGVFTFTGLADGGYAVPVEVHGFAPVVRQVAVSAGTPTTIEIQDGATSRPADAPIIARIHATAGYPLTAVAGISLRFGSK
ncbi:MAG: carboxypeptidase-like regulatory domain-containing protein [Bryobacteraceae bacterium]